MNVIEKPRYNKMKGNQIVRLPFIFAFIRLLPQQASKLYDMIFQRIPHQIGSFFNLQLIHNARFIRVHRF